ncbi:radical SAM protein, partial [Candidatus Woesearchaeota archaeon]|nr:radical SAM protein [Candidatus Woesearchaeota archaeon]
ERLDDETMKEYLSREFSLYVSQGCEKSCSFCGADRTSKNPLTGETKKVNERYRDISLLENDLDYLVHKAKSFGLEELQLYMSNLDVFQTPQQLLRFAYAVQEVKRSNPNFRIGLRGLATVEYFLETRRVMPESIEELVKAGFHTVGFGVDGWGKKEWAALRKGHNTEEGCLEAIRSTRVDFGITPEILMVFGNPRTTKEDSIREAYEITRTVVDKFKAVPRPHVSKDFIPGNDGWKREEYFGAVETLLNNPEAFQSLDFTALPSELTHPEREVRDLATEYFLKMCDLPGNTTKPVKPITPGLSLEEIKNIKKENEGKFDR